MKIFFLFLLFQTFSCATSEKRSSPVTLKKQAVTNVSLLQEKRDIHCNSDTIRNLVLDKRDKFLKFNESGAQKLFTDVAFFDDAVLLKSSESHVIFHVLRNGQINLLIGQLFEFRESDCEDTGSSKTCRTEKIQRLHWTPTKIRFNSKSFDLNLNVTRYGFFPNDANYFLADSNNTSLMILDFGARLNILVGTRHQLSCHYLD